MLDQLPKDCRRCEHLIMNSFALNKRGFFIHCREEVFLGQDVSVETLVIVCTLAINCPFYSPLKHLLQE